MLDEPHATNYPDDMLGIRAFGDQSYEPTVEQRRTVQVLYPIGIPQEQIALLLEIDPKTLRKHFRDDLDRGMAEANVKIAQSLFNMATVGNNVAAAIFWMKARAGWREKHEITVSANPLEQVSDAELEQMITVLRDQIAEQEAIQGHATQIGHQSGLVGSE
jgi:hypothetical protein